MSAVSGPIKRTGFLGSIVVGAGLLSFISVSLAISGPANAQEVPDCENTMCVFVGSEYSCQPAWGKTCESYGGLNCEDWSCGVT